MLAPIVLFVYNRPRHTRQTLEALSRNTLAGECVLYIYADGAPEAASAANIERVEAVRNLIRAKNWCREVFIVEREKNLGLAANIVDGVTTIIDKYGKAIVLEDDIVTSPGFLKYMNDALNLYEQEEKVMHISGYMFPVKGKLPETFFYNTASCWGWATWKRAWQHFTNDAARLLSEVEKKDIAKFNIRNSYNFYGQLKDNAEGRIKTWAVKWYAVIFLNNGFSLHPYPSLVNNIGNDGEGENSGKTSVFSWRKTATFIDVKRISIVERSDVIDKMVAFNKKIESSYRQPIPLTQLIRRNVPSLLRQFAKVFIRKAGT
jgi:hypothetical protein